ncbi:hypothetical protein J6590_033865 [Homalodisca vitripennis]|nr:hypothetical protein J6590_033865 [Homalodisca vitripennis]
MTHIYDVRQSIVVTPGRCDSFRSLYGVSQSQPSNTFARLNEALNSPHTLNSTDYFLTPTKSRSHCSHGLYHIHQSNVSFYRIIVHARGISQAATARNRPGKSLGIGRNLLG